MRRILPAAGAVCLVLLCGTSPASAQPALRITTSAPLTSGLEHLPMIEPHVAAHPAEPGWLLAATMIAPPAAEFAAMRSRITCALFLSRDSGASWQRTDLPLTTCYDPNVAFTADGTAVFSVLASHPAHAHEPEALLVFRSADGGATWDSVPVSLGTGHDRPMLVAGGNPAQDRSWLYLASSRTIRAEHGASREAVFVARTRNGARTFDEPRVITPSNLVTRTEQPVVLPDGALVVSYVEAGHVVPGPRGVRELERRRAFTIESRDGGTTFGTPLFITEACGPPRFSPSALVVHGSSSAHAPRLTHFCNAAGGAAVVATTSVPGTEHWSEPAPIHPALAEGHSPRVRAAATDTEGILAVVYAVRSEHDALRCYEVFVTASIDGGESFLPPEPLSAQRYCLDPARNGATINSWPDGGDYFGITAGAPGRFHVVWPDARSGVFQTWTATITVAAR